MCCHACRVVAGRYPLSLVLKGRTPTKAQCVLTCSWCCLLQPVTSPCRSSCRHHQQLQQPVQTAATKAAAAVAAAVRSVPAVCVRQTVMVLMQCSKRVRWSCKCSRTSLQQLPFSPPQQQQRMQRWKTAAGKAAARGLRLLRQWKQATRTWTTRVSAPSAMTNRPRVC